ncbi:tetratricopeptide repeat protein [bacterium]|nr:tetratricopeptide repeat protein [bacterium]
MNSLQKIILFSFILIIFSSTNCPAAAKQPKLYDYIQKISKWIKPLPLLYAQKSDRRSEYDNMMKILFSLMRYGDTLIIMTSDGDYAAFVYKKKNEIILNAIPYENLNKEFKNLLNKYNRVWVVVVDHRAGWQAQPPAQYLPVLKKDYMDLPLPMPTYFANKSVAVGSTNFWLGKAKLLEKVAGISSENRNPRLYLRLGQVYRRFGRLEDAVKAYEKGIKHFPEDPFLHRELGECYYWEYSPPLLEESIKENRIANQCHINKFGKPKYDAMFNIAMAYRDLGELMKAQLQYNDILRAVNEFPDNYFESQTRRYLANVYLETGRTNDAILQYKLDIKLAAQPLPYSYNKLLDYYDGNNDNKEYKSTVNEYFQTCGMEDPAAIMRYMEYLKDENDEQKIIENIKITKKWMQSNTNLFNRIKSKPEWWNVWTNITINSGISPVTSKK